MWGNVGMRWSLFERDFASRPVDAPPCGPLRRGLALHFPALTRQQDGARHLMLAAGVIRHLPPRQPGSFGRIGQAQTVFPTPSDELDRIGPPVLLERHLEKPRGAHVDFSRPHDSMATLADAGERERRGIPQWTHTLEPKNGLAKVNGKHLFVCPPQAQCVITFVLDVRNADRVALVHRSSSEYCCHRAHSSGPLEAAQASASSLSRGSASPAQPPSVLINNTSPSS